MIIDWESQQGMGFFEGLSDALMIADSISEVSVVVTEPLALINTDVISIVPKKTIIHFN
jgi:hypothetical protein